METQEMMEFLLAEMKADQARTEAKLVASHKKMMAMLDVHHEKIMASLKDGGYGFQGNPRGNEICNGASGGR
jgi:hypothetical protein